MNKKALSLAVCLAMALPTASKALSLGDIESNSSLNQPFRGTISLLSTSIAEASSLKVRVASPAVFNRVGIDRPAFLNSIRFRTTVKNGRPVILVSSNQAINEPFLNFLLEVSWPNGQLLKEYTVLLDPPVLVQPDTAIASSAAGVRQDPGQNQAYRQQVSQPTQVAARQQPRRVVRTAAPTRQTKLRRPGPPRRTASSSRSRVKNYRVRRGDTLYKISKKLGYKGIRNEQMMVALFEKNKRAFSKRNMNNLKAGAVLSRPSYQEAKSTSSRRAKSKVIAQARAWKKERAGVATVKKSSRPNKTVAATNKVKQARVEVMGGGNKSINPNAVPGGSGTSNELRKQLALTNEALTTRLKENDELKSRVSELESLLRKKNKLITLKSEQLSRLQDKIGGASTGQLNNLAQTTPAVNTNTTNESVRADDDDGTGIQQAVATAEANREGTILRTDPEQLAIGTNNPPIQEEEILTSVEDPFVKTGNETTEGSSLDIMGLLGSPAAMGIGGGTLLALLGGFWFMRRRKETDDDYQEFGSIDIDDQMDDMNFDDAGIAESDSGIDEPDFGSLDDLDQEAQNTQETSSSDNITQGNEQEDILQEADVYIVYGLHDQAESELKRAIDSDPTNLAYRAKLLENYKSAGNKEAFEDEAKDFLSLNIDGKDKYLAEITDWGNTLLPGNTLFDTTNDGGSTLKSAAVAAGAAGVAMVAGKALADSDDDSKEKDSDSLIDDLDNKINLDLDLDDSLDENIDNLDDIDLDSITSEAGDNDFDFDIKKSDDLADDFGFDIEKEISDEEFNLEMDSTEKLLASVDNDDIDFLDSDDIEAPDTFDIAGELSTDTDDSALGLVGGTNDLDLASLNLNLDAEDFDKIMPKDNAYKKQISDDAPLDVSNAPDDLDEDNLLADFDDNLSFLDLDDDSEMIEETQIDTKLDLARAYIDMGDIEGARSTLEEVLLEGSDEQKKEAEDLLHQTG